eukprot:TRINITY_DN989_c1_g2_i1.p1 TRINITY_DN989_c1_g2~~TRINITY_DN989_c1_g2_i1.p1  ORF type:complete len:130 (-),score=11.54 TRINITY_DN989_c1_g2_i1:308-697(-)
MLLADMVCLIYGKPAAFGVVTKPMNIRDGINSFLDGCVEQENVRFRSCALNFKMQTENEEVYSEYRWPYLKIEKSFGGDSAFTLAVEPDWAILKYRFSVCGKSCCFNMHVLPLFLGSRNSKIRSGKTFS